MSIFLHHSRTAIAVIIFLIAPFSLCAQITDVTNSTSTPISGAGHDYIKLLSETVDPANGSLSLRMETSPPRGRQLSLPFAFAYDSNGFYFVQGTPGGGAAFVSQPFFLSQGGWTYSIPVISDTHLSQTIARGLKGSWVCIQYTGYVFQDASGGRHSLGLGFGTGAIESPCPTTAILSGGDPLVTAALDKSVRQVSVVDADGTVYSFSPLATSHNAGTPHEVALVALIEDRNGNDVSINDLNLTAGAAAGAFNMTDTLGRTLIASSGFGSTGNTVSISGFSQPYTLSWGTSNVNFHVSSTQVGTDTQCTPVGGGSGTSPVVSTITLPNGKQFQFAYDSTYGKVNKVTYPSGSYVLYSWGLNPQSALAVYSDTAGGARGVPVYL
jgi:hypothetical protein